MKKFLSQHFLFYFTLFLSFVAAGTIRWWAAPLSAGPDVAQFWGFAHVFAQKGFSFYRYAGAELEIFAYKGWAFCYTPIWLFVLTVSYLFAPESLASTNFIDPAWRVAMKTPLIGADLMIGLLLYLLVPGSRWRKLGFAALWLFSPIAWYQSSVFGQFDSLMVVFLMSGLYCFQENRKPLAMLFFGLAVMTKQHSAVALLFLLVPSWRSWLPRERLLNLSILAGVGLTLSLPFVIGGGLETYWQSLMGPLGWLQYQDPIVYAFSGLSSLLTQLHYSFNWDTLSIMGFIKWIHLFFLLFALSWVYRKQCSPELALLLGFLSLFSLANRVNYQYLIAYIPLALFLAGKTKRQWERRLLLTLAIYPSIWLWMFDLSFWFRFTEPRTISELGPLHFFGFSEVSFSYWVYVAFSLGLTMLMGLYLWMALRSEDAFAKITRT